MMSLPASAFAGAQGEPTDAPAQASPKPENTPIKKYEPVPNAMGLAYFSGFFGFFVLPLALTPKGAQVMMVAHTTGAIAATIATAVDVQPITATFFLVAGCGLVGMNFYFDQAGSSRWAVFAANFGAYTAYFVLATYLSDFENRSLWPSRSAGGKSGASAWIPRPALLVAPDSRALVLSWRL